MAEGAVRDIPTPVEDYAYDEEGNRSASHLSAFYSSNPHNQLLEDDNYNYTYDDRGNRVTRTDKANGAVETYSYDNQNRLVGYASDVATASYAYDALDRRIAKTVDGVETAYAYDTSFVHSLAYDDISLEYIDNTLSRRWLHSNSVDEPIGFEEYLFDRSVGAGAKFEVLTDRLGSIMSIVNVGNGEIVSTYSYDSFGNQTQVGTFIQPYGFTGREHDQESRLGYFRARHLDFNLGRFVQLDPLEFGSNTLNLVVYGDNNPHNTIDPSGLVSPVQCGVGRGS